MEKDREKTLPEILILYCALLLALVSPQPGERRGINP